MDKYINQRIQEIAEETNALKKAKIIQILTNILLNTSYEVRRETGDDDWIIDMARGFLFEALELMGVPYDDKIARSDDPLAMILERLKNDTAKG